MEMMSPPFTLALTRPVATEPSGNFVRMWSQFFFCSAFVERQDGASVAVLQLFDQHLNRGPDLQVADVDKFVCGYDALGLAADVDNHLVLADFGDGTGDDGAFLELVEGGLSQQLLH